MPLKKIYNHDFSKMSNPDVFCKIFFDKTLSLADLKIIHDYVQGNTINFAGKIIPAAIYLKGTNSDNSQSSANVSPFVILAQLHGNEPAGLAGIALAMALSDAGFLQNDVI